MLLTSRVVGELLGARHPGQHPPIERAAQLLPVAAQPGVAEADGAGGARRFLLAEGVERVAGFHDPGLAGVEPGGVTEGGEEPGEERPEERLGGLRPFEPERDPGPHGPELPPELVALDGDPLPVQDDHQAARRALRVELLFDLGLQPLEDLVDLMPPGREQALPAEQGLCPVLHLSGIASPNFAAARLGLHAPQAGEGLRELRPGETGQPLQERAQVRLLGSEEARPSLDLGPEVGAERHGEPPQEVAVLAQQAFRFEGGPEPHGPQ